MIGGMHSDVEASRKASVLEQSTASDSMNLSLLQRVVNNLALDTLCSMLQGVFDSIRICIRFDVDRMLFSNSVWSVYRSTRFRAYQ